VQQLQVLVEAPPAVVEGAAGELVVVGAAAHPQAKGEATLRDLVQAGCDLGQVDRLVGRGQQHVGEQADPVGRGRGHGEGGQRVVARVGDPVDGGQRGEAALLRPPGPVDHEPPGNPQDRVGKADADLHAVVLLWISMVLSAPERDHHAVTFTVTIPGRAAVTMAVSVTLPA
jgi:hypothetical protein